MTSITIPQTTKTGTAAIAKRILEILTAFGKTLVNPPTPVVLDKNAILEMGISPQDVENNLSNPAWRKLGRYL